MGEEGGTTERAGHLKPHLISNEQEQLHLVTVFEAAEGDRRARGGDAAVAGRQVRVGVAVADCTFRAAEEIAGAAAGAGLDLEAQETAMWVDGIDKTGVQVVGVVLAAVEEEGHGAI